MNRNRTTSDVRNHVADVTRRRRGYTAGLVIALLATLMMAPTAAHAQNAVAYEVTVQQDGPALETRFLYGVTSLIPSMTSPNTIAIGLDKDGDGLIDGPGTLLHSEPGALGFSLLEAVTVDLAPGLDALPIGLRVEDGDHIVAQVDYGDVTAETDETDNAVSSHSLSVDLVAASLTMGSNHMATLTYVVNSIAIVDDFDVAFYLDENHNHAIDPGDTLVASQTVSGAVGAGYVSVDFSGSYPENGQSILASVDDGGVVGESDEDNNVVEFIASDDVDLVVGLLTYDEISQEAVLSYDVIAPVDVPAYEIHFFLDKDNSGALGPDDEPAVKTISGDVTPGMHVTPAQGFGTHAPIGGQLIFAKVDFFDTVSESDESDASNVAAAQNTDALDLVATALTYDSNTQSATFSYWVNSPTTLPPLTINFYADVNGDGDLTVGHDLKVDSVFRPGTPGAYVVVADFSGSPLASGQEAFALIVPGNSIDEDDDTNNMASAINTTPTDLVAVSLAYDANTQEATLSYVVDAPIAVPAFSIEFAIDTDGDDAFTSADDTFPLVAGNPTPGAHTYVMDCSTMPAEAGQYVFASIDLDPSPSGLVSETDELGNNEVATYNTAETDLEAVALTYDANTQRATLAYVVRSPIPVAGNAIEFYLDVNDNDTLDSNDPAIDAVAGEVAPGGYIITGDFSSNPPVTGQAIFAKVESDEAVTESDEDNNVASAVNTMPTDLHAVSLTYDANTQEATLNFDVNAPVDVPLYNIRFFLDTDGSTTFTFGDEIIETVPAVGMTAPGSYTLVQSYTQNPASSGQYIFATVDAIPPWPFGSIIESDETNNRVTGVNTDGIDIEVVSVSYDADLKEATLSYVVHSSIDVDPFDIHFYIDNGDYMFDDADDTPVDSTSGMRGPGGHTATGNFSLNAPGTNQMVFAVVDSSDDVTEDDEDNNVGAARNWSPTDLTAISIAYDSNTEKAVLSYSVVSPINVPDYEIRFYLDRNNSGILDLGDGPLVATMMGEVAPGSYTTPPVSFTDHVPATEQCIFASVDRFPWPTGVVTESDESYFSNVATTSNTQATNLVANSVHVFVDDVNNTTTASVSYTIYSPLPVAPFSLKVGLDRDSNGVIDGGGSDLFADINVSNSIDLTPGAHVIDIPNFRAVLNNMPIGSRINYGDFIVATLDLNQDGSPAGAVTESEEWLDNSVTTTPTVDLVANALIIVTDQSAASTKARIAYTVDSPGAVEEFQILVGVDRDNNGTIDTPADVLITIPVDNNRLRPGTREILTANFRTELNAVTPKLEQGDRIIAILDLNQDNTPGNDVEELEEHDNNIVRRMQRVDLVANAVSLNTDVLGGTTEAEVSYTVDSAGSTPDFSLKIGLDRDGDGLIDDPDGLLADQTLTGADVEPGAHTVTVTGLRAALNGLTTPIKNGDAIVATLDLVLAGTDEGAVNEDIEKNNNSASQIQTVDLVANSIAIQSDDQTAMTSVSVSYLVVSPADAAPFDILIGVDRDGDDLIDGDATDVLATVAAPGLTPGTHTLDIANIRPALEALATRLAEGDRIIATLDLDAAGLPANAVVEAAEVDNNFAAQTQTVDLVATETSLFTAAGSGAKKVRVSYTVVSPGTVGTFNVRVGIDADNNGVLDPGSALRIYDVETDLGIAWLRPGEHQITTDDLTAELNAHALENGARVIATLDLADVDPYDVLVENLVAESEDLANNRARQPLDVDLLAISLAYDATTNYATLSYSVNSEVGVPAYDITFYLDSDKDGSLDPLLDALVGTVAGATVPGSYTAVGDYNTTQVDTHQFIFAVLDIADDVNELDETNNEAGTNNTEITDLIANGVTLVSDNIANETKATIAYTIIAPEPFTVPAFDILVGVDRDGDNQIDAATDVLETIAAPDLTPGAHEVTSADLRPALEALADRLDNGDRIIAMLDLTFDGTTVNNVEEIGGDEIANNVAGYAVQVDLIATDLDIFKVPATGELLGQVNYTIAGPATVDPFVIRIGVDADDDKIMDAGSLLATIDLTLPSPVDNLRPGDHMVESVDLTAVLNALPIPLNNGDRLIAIVDLLEDGTAENLVVETDELDNNVVRAMQTVDLVAQSIFLTIDNDAMTTAATVTYNINSIGYTADFNLRIGIDRDSDDIIDANPGDELFTAVLTGADVLPGEHTFVVADIRAAINALSPSIEYGNRIVATLDLDLLGADELAVVEMTEVGNNVTSTAGTQDQIIDISADELNINVGSFIVTATYTVTGPGNVAPFDINIGRDTDADNVIDDLLITIAGDPTPGTHQVQEDVADELLALGVASNELVNIVVDVDAGGTVAELSEANNKLVGSDAYEVDLVVRRLTHPCAMLDNAFDVDVEYQVMYNQPSEDFRICIYASGDDAAAATPGDVELVCFDVVDPANKTVGDHLITVNGALFSTTIASASAIPPEHFFVKVEIDSLAVVKETDETNNWAARPNAAQDASEDPDGDGVPDCWDECPDDPNKVEPGVCGCGVVDDLTDADFDGVFACLDPDDNDANVPNPQDVPPGAQEVPGDGSGGGLEVVLPIFPAMPFPVCGIGLCGSGAMIPMGVMLLGFVGMKTWVRRRKRR